MLKLTTILCLTLSLTSCEPANSRFIDREDTVIPEGIIVNTDAAFATDTTKPVKPKQVNKYYPFELQELDGQYQIVSNLESDDLYSKYYAFFQKHGYEGNGYCWEGHITQILEKLDKKLLSHIDFDPEAGAFYAYTDSKENQLKFVELLSPIFLDLKKLEEWVKKADRSRIDD